MWITYWVSFQSQCRYETLIEMLMKSHVCAFAVGLFSLCNILFLL